jgi:hypothetical protein
MRFVAFLLVLVVVLSACNSDGPPSSRPQDFRLEYDTKILSADAETQPDQFYRFALTGRTVSFLSRYQDISNTVTDFMEPERADSIYLELLEAGLFNVATPAAPRAFARPDSGQEPVQHLVLKITAGGKQYAFYEKRTGSSSSVPMEFQQAWDNALSMLDRSRRAIESRRARNIALIVNSELTDNQPHSINVSLNGEPMFEAENLTLTAPRLMLDTLPTLPGRYRLHTEVLRGDQPLYTHDTILALDTTVTRLQLNVTPDSLGLVTQ